MNDRDFDIVPGVFVRLDEEADWGVGQVQSYIGHRITVNFEHQGKVVLDSTRAALRVVEE